MSDPGQGNPITSAAAGVPEQAPAAPPDQGPAGAQALNMPGAGQAGDVLKFMKSQMDQTAAQVKKLKQAQGRATVVRQALDKLVSMGDTVNPEDITKESSKLVAAGMAPEEVAGFLADMPQGSEALQGWVAQHDQSLRANEAKLTEMVNLQQHKLGVQALHHIGAVSMVNHGLAKAPLMSQSASPPPPGPSSNPITGGL